MRIFITFILFVITTSCATVLNKNFTEVDVYSKQDSVKVFFTDSTGYAYTPVRLQVERSRAPLFLTLEKDSVQKTVIIASKLTPEFLFGNIINGSFYLGYLVDLSNDKRFTYPSKIYCDIESSHKTNFKYKPNHPPTSMPEQPIELQKAKQFAGEKGTIAIKFSIPEGNSFIINKKNHVGYSWGFLGITTGVDYYYKDKQYIGIGAGALTDFIMPIPAPYDPFGEYERSFGSYIDVIHGFDVHRFSCNYGLNASKYSYYKSVQTELYPNYVDTLLYSHIENRLGVSISSKVKITNYFNCGIRYMPSFYTFNTHNFRYGHFLFFDIAINFNLKH